MTITPTGRVLTALASVAALLLLNGLLSFRNWWPTPGVLPDLRLSPDAVALWGLLLVLVAWRGQLSPRWLTALSVLLLLMVIGRYANVTVPTLFGRPVNLYWDGQQIPRFLWVSARESPAWVSVLAVSTVLALGAVLYASLRWTIGRLAGHAAPYALRRRWTWWPTLAAAATVVVHQAGAAPHITWHLVTDPVTPTYARQARLLATAFLPGAIEATVPRAPGLQAAAHRGRRHHRQHRRPAAAVQHRRRTGGAVGQQTAQQRR